MDIGDNNELSNLPPALSTFLSTNGKNFTTSMEILKDDALKSDLGFNPNPNCFFTLNFSGPEQAFRVLMSVGYPKFYEPVNLSSLELLFESEFTDIILEFLCKVGTDLPESIKAIISKELIKQLSECGWENLESYDFSDWNVSDPAKKRLSLLLACSVRFNLDPISIVIEEKRFKFFLNWLIQAKNNILSAEVYLLIISHFSEKNDTLFYSYWDYTNASWIDLLLKKINSRQALVCLMAILYKSNCAEQVLKVDDDNLYKNIWNFMLNNNNQHERPFFLKLCNQSSNFTIACFNKFIEYFLKDPADSQDKIISVLKLQKESMLYANINQLIVCPDFQLIVDALLQYQKTRDYLIIFVDSLLQSQLWMEEFLKQYFILVSREAAGKTMDSIVLRQMITYTLIGNVLKLKNEGESIFKEYICNLMEFLEKNLIELEDCIKYRTQILEISRYIPNLHEFIVKLAFEKYNTVNNLYLENRVFFARISQLKINVNIKIPQKILDIFQSITNYLDSSKTDSDKATLRNLGSLYMDVDIDLDISYEQITAEGAIECWICSVLIKKGIKNLLEATTLLQNDIEYIKQILEKLKISLAFENIFNENIPMPIRLYFVSHFSTIFFMNLKQGTHDNIVIEANSHAIQLIGSRCESILPADKALLLLIVRSNVACAAFLKYGYNIANAEGFEERTFYVDLPLKIHGVTVLGGAILINSVTKQETPFYKCIKIIAYLHELAHALRKIETGRYSLNSSTPPKFEDFYEGSPMVTRTDYCKNETAQKEGGMQLESILFGNFVNKVNEEQISFIIDIDNWDMTLERFKSELNRLNSRSSTYLHLGREQYYSIDRSPHINFSFAKEK